MDKSVKKVLFIGGSRNQTTQMHQVAEELPEVDAWFTPHYATGLEEALRALKLAEFTVIGNKHVERCTQYLTQYGLQIDYRGQRNDYDLVVTSSDLVVPRNIVGKPIVLVQEGMTDPETWVFELVRRWSILPRWLAGTATNGLSDQYAVFCVASEGYRQLFEEHGVNPAKMRVTGIPNFDNCQRFRDNDFPYRDYVLVCTSDLREKLRYENRRQLIESARRLAEDRLLIFKLHPNEHAARASREIHLWAPEALVFSHGCAEEMIANCGTFFTRYSSTVFVALALGKEVYCDLDVQRLKKLVPLQNAAAARNIATVCRQLLQDGQAPNHGRDSARNRSITFSSSSSCGTATRAVAGLVASRRSGRSG
jgi:hypothetical protein